LERAIARDDVASLEEKETETDIEASPPEDDACLPEDEEAPAEDPCAARDHDGASIEVAGSPPDVDGRPPEEDWLLLLASWAAWRRFVSRFFGGRGARRRPGSSSDPVERRILRAMLYMVVERFKNGDAKAIYARLDEKGRMMPDGLEYVGSWIETNFDRCFQVMQTDDERLLREWADRWRDLMELEFVPVRTSAQARAVALGEQEPRKP
jgi:hypothetical protein